MLTYVSTNSSIEHEQGCVIKKIRIKYERSPGEKTTRKEATHSKKPTRLVFDDELTEVSSNEVSQKNRLGAEVGEALTNRDITDYEWAMQYIDSKSSFYRTRRT